ncbi:MAG: hypothetical protein JWO59_777, partial [Chloroflexi bacterium]|nr:hypothetical protein [Chloroflexota bacterium]
EILDALWDGAADEQTFGAFRKASYQIRRFLGGDVWQRVHGAYVLTTPVDDDYRTLLALAVSLEDADAPPADVAAMATQALGLYTGPYLQWCYSDWTEGPRRLSQTAVLTVISALVTARRKLGQPAAALEAAERGLALEPSSETLRQSQIQLLTELGRPVEALESYRYHLRVLEDEDLGSPSEALRTLVALIKR